MRSLLLPLLLVSIPAFAADPVPATPKEEPAKPADPAEGAAKPSDGAVKPSDAAAKPSDGAAAPAAAGPAAAGPAEGVPAAAGPAAAGPAAAGPAAAGPAEAAPAEAAPPVALDPEVAQKAFNARQLKLDDIDNEDPSYQVLLRANPKIAPWGVAQGDGHALSAREFATLTQDNNVLTRIDHSKQLSRTTSLGLIVGGGVLLGLSVVPLILIDGEGGDPGAQPSQQNFSSTEEYVYALEDWRAARTVQAQNSSKVWGSVALATTGGLALASAPFAKRGAAEREGAITAWYTPDDAQKRMNVYNKKLAVELGIVAPEAPPPKAVKFTPREVEDELDDPLDGAPVDPPEGEPVDPPGDGGGPDEPPAVQLHPMIGFGYIGLSGSF